MIDAIAESKGWLISTEPMNSRLLKSVISIGTIVFSGGRLVMDLAGAEIESLRFEIWIPAGAWC